MQHEDLTRKIIGCAMAVHRTLGPGFLELVYQNAFVHEMRKQGLSVEPKKKITVRYDDVVVGNFEADVLVEEEVMIEIKAVEHLIPAHEVQLVNYLTATGRDIGLLINFGASSLSVKRKYRTYRPSGGEPDC